MNAQVLNFKAYSSGSMAGFFDLSVNGLVVTGCKAFVKEDRFWFTWPSEKIQDKEGNDKWRDIVTAAEPVMRHLQGIVRPQLRALVLGDAGGDRRVQDAAAVLEGRVKQGGESYGSEHADRGYQESRRAAAAGGDDIPF